MKTKRCPCCEETLAVAKFASHPTRPDGLQGYCRTCQSEKRAAWAAKDKAKRAAAAASTAIAATSKPSKRMDKPTTPTRRITAIPEAGAQITTTNLMEHHARLERPAAPVSESARLRPSEGAGEEAAVDRLAVLPLTAIVPSLTNPRKHFDQAFLLELAESIRLQGLATPILVRPLPRDRLAETFGDRRKGAPLPTHEVIAGEQRLRASAMAGKRTIPVLIRELDDDQVLQLQLVENLKRRDLHPMEEAEGYERLRDHTGMTAEDIADRIGKGRSYVYKTIKLLDLVAEARTAFFEGKLTRSTAELVAAREPGLQLQILKDITATDFHGDPMSFRKAKAHIDDRYMLRLDSAPFAINDALLVPAVGSCQACPKRTGSSPQLFDDAAHADTCSDPNCFSVKKDAHYTRIRIEAEAKGKTVIVGREAKEIMPDSNTLRGYTKVDDTQLGGKMKTLRKVLGDAMPPTTLIEDSRTHELVEVLSTAVVGKLLKEQGIEKSGEQRSEAERERELVERVETTWRTKAVEAIFEATESRIVGLGPVVMRMIAELLLDGLTKEARQHVCKLLNIGTIADREGIQAALRESEAGKLESLLLLLFVQHDMRQLVDVHHKPTPSDRIVAVAADIGVDVFAIRTEVFDERAAELAEAAAKKPAAAPAAAPGRPARKPKATAAETTAAIAQQLQALESP